MCTYKLSHVSDSVLLRDLNVLVARDRATTAELLAHLAEVDERRLYLPAAHPSMFSWCVQELGFSEDAAFKRIRAARAARRFPVIYAAIANGRLNLSAVVLLAPHLTRDNAAGLIAAAAGQTRASIERLLAERFPRPDLPERLVPLPPGLQVAPGPVESFQAQAAQLAPGPVEAQRGRPALEAGHDRAELPAAQPSQAGMIRLAPGPVAAPVPQPRVAPLAPERFALQLTIGQSTHDKLRYAQSLLAHRLQAGDLAQVLDRALDALIAQLERRKFAATSRPRKASGRQSPNPRYIPAAIRQAVWKRDQGRCTFVSERGQRCPERARLEYDHVHPVARGGEATIEGVRLRCRAHNQYAAECAFGAGFMHEKREAARKAAALRRAAAVRDTGDRGRHARVAAAPA